MAEFSYCLNTSTIRPTPLRAKIEAAGAAGFDAIEPWFDEVAEAVAGGDSLAAIRRAIDDAGLKVASMIALGGWATADASRWPAVRDECCRRLETAAVLGSPFVVASPPMGRLDPRLAAGRFAELAQLGRLFLGVRPTMEFLGFVEQVHTLASAREIAEGSGAAGWTVVADVFHLLRGGGSIDDLTTLRGDQMAIFHINDLPSTPPFRHQNDSDRVMLGDGVADLPKVIAHLRAIGYRGPLSLELFNADLWRRDPGEVARLGLERLRGLVEG